MDQRHGCLMLLGYVGLLLVVHLPWFDLPCIAKAAHCIITVFLAHYTPRLWRVGCNSFDIVCLCVRLLVYHSDSRTDIHTDLGFWRGDQVEECTGQVYRHRSRSYRSKVKVTRSTTLRWDVPLTSERMSMDLPKKKLRNTTWGVFKAYAVSLSVRRRMQSRVTHGVVK